MRLIFSLYEQSILVLKYRGFVPFPALFPFRSPFPLLLAVSPASFPAICPFPTFLRSQTFVNRAAQCHALFALLHRLCFVKKYDIHLQPPCSTNTRIVLARETAGLLFLLLLLLFIYLFIIQSCTKYGSNKKNILKKCKIK